MNRMMMNQMMMTNRMMMKQMINVQGRQKPALFFYQNVANLTKVG